MANIRRRIRAQYRCKVRFIKRQEDAIRATKMAEGLLRDNGRDMWREVRKVTAKSGTMPTSVDGAVGDKDIASLFAQKNAELFSSVPYDRERLQELIRSVGEDVAQCRNSNCYNRHRVTHADIVEGVKCMKKGKRDGACDFSSDFQINGTNDLYVHLSLLLNAVLIHGRAPHDFFPEHCDTDCQEQEKTSE